MDRGIPLAYYIVVFRSLSRRKVDLGAAVSPKEKLTALRNGASHCFHSQYFWSLD